MVDFLIDREDDIYLTTYIMGHDFPCELYTYKKKDIHETKLLKQPCCTPMLADPDAIQTRLDTKS